LHTFLMSLPQLRTCWSRQLRFKIRSHLERLAAIKVLSFY
ncbi:hypothetical protein CSA_023905, partial [Cucumis sativus]